MLFFFFNLFLLNIIWIMRLQINIAYAKANVLIIWFIAQKNTLQVLSHYKIVRYVISLFLFLVELSLWIPRTSHSTTGSKRSPPCFQICAARPRSSVTTFALIKIFLRHGRIRMHITHWPTWNVPISRCHSPISHLPLLNYSLFLKSMYNRKFDHSVVFFLTFNKPLHLFCYWSLS